MPHHPITVYNEEDLGSDGRIAELWTAYDEGTPGTFETASTAETAVNALCARLGLSLEQIDVRTRTSRRALHPRRPYRRKWYLLKRGADYWAGDGRWLPHVSDGAECDTREEVHAAMTAASSFRGVVIEVHYEPLPPNSRR